MLAGDPSAPVSARVRATLALLEKMTKMPHALTPEDVRVVIRAGVSKPAIEEALEVAFLFNILDRLADAMGWAVPARDSGAYEAAAKRMLSHGYR